MTTHTPGPRIYDKITDCFAIRAECSMGAHAWTETDDSQCESNARLIAAAPDLLAASSRARVDLDHLGTCLEELGQLCREGEFQGAEDWATANVDIANEAIKTITALRAAITKATVEPDDDQDEPGTDIDRHGVDRSPDAEAKRVDDAYERHVQSQMLKDMDEPDRAGHPDMDSAGGDDSLNQAYRLK